MAGLNIGGVTINAKEIESYSEVIREIIVNDLTLQSLHEVKTGVKNKEQILFSTKMGKVGQKSAGDCTLPTSTATSDFSEKFWDLETIEERLILCNKTIDKSFKPNNPHVKSWIDRYDFSGSEQEAFIIMLLAEAVIDMIWRATWFGDTAVAAADAGNAGLIAATAAANVKYYNYFDGIWKQIFDGVTATDITRVTITENAVTTSKDDQLALADYAAKGYFAKVKSAAPVSLRNAQGAMMMVSRELFDNYEDGLIKDGVHYDIDYEMNGLPSIKFRGYTVVNMETIWSSDDKDGGTREDFTNNTTTNVYDKPHRIVFTTKENIPVGTLSEGDWTNFMSNFSIETMKNYIDFGLELESKVLVEKEIVVAF